MYEAIPENPERETTTVNRRRWSTAAVAALVGVAGLAGFGKLDSATLGAASRLWTTRPTVAGYSAASSRGKQPSIALSSAHERRTGIPYGSGMYKYEYLAEVHKATRIEVQDPDDDCTYKWSVQGSHGTEKGSTFETTFKSVGKHRVHLATSCSTGETKSVYEVSVKYVRKELRQLTTKERL